MTDERLDGESAENFVLASAALARTQATSPTWFAPSLHALEAAYSERPLLMAPVLVFDLTALLNGERLLPVPPPGVASVRDALRGYEDHLLARLTLDARFTRLTEAFAALPKPLRAQGVGLLTAQLLARLRVEGGTAVSPALIRRLAPRVGEGLLEAGRLALSSPEVSARVARELDALAAAARRTRALLSDAEVFLVENLAALKTLGARVALSQLAQASQRLEEQLPARIRTAALEEGDAPTQLDDESVFPAGGFSSLTTRGAPENLVVSELIYMGGPRPDLFDVRFVENELLYYERDEAVAVRRRRVVALVFDESLTRAAVKDAGEAYQRLVWLLGAVTALVRKLSAWLDSEALHIELHFAWDHDERVLRELQDVLALLLRDFIERRQVSFTNAKTTAEATLAVRQRHARRARVLAFAASWPQGLDGDAAPDVLIDAGSALPRAHWLHAADASEEATGSAHDAWAKVTLALLHGLLRRG